MKKDETTNTELSDDFADLENQKEVYGRIYRIISPLESVGRPAREFVGKVEERVDEDYIGRIFGPGRYNIHYRVTRSDGSKFERDETFNIGQEYAKKDAPQAPVKQAPAATFGGLDVGALLGGLTVEKITAIGAAVKMRIAERIRTVDNIQPGHVQECEVILLAVGVSAHDIGKRAVHDDKSVRTVSNYCGASTIPEFKSLDSYIRRAAKCYSRMQNRRLRSG
jgi:hypothetical protein